MLPEDVPWPARRSLLGYGFVMGFLAAFVLSVYLGRLRKSTLPD